MRVRGSKLAIRSAGGGNIDAPSIETVEAEDPDERRGLAKVRFKGLKLGFTVEQGSQ